MDSRCRNFGNPTGEYTLYADNYFLLGARTFIDLRVPFGGALNALVESAFRVVGGNSQSNLLDVGVGSGIDFGEAMIEKLGAKWAKWATVSANVYNGIDTVSSTIESLDIVQMDAMAFSMINRNNLSVTSTSKKSLETRMDNIYNYIWENPLYFSLLIDGKNTLFSIDRMLSRSYTATRSHLMKTYADNLPRNGSVNVVEALLAFGRLLDSYEGRLNQIDNDVKKFWE